MERVGLLTPNAKLEGKCRVVPLPTVFPVAAPAGRGQDCVCDVPMASVPKI